jgi:threonine dehydratase
VVTVTEAEIAAATVALWQRAKLVVEPSGAVGVAALAFGHLDVAGKRVGILVSGGNVSPERLAAIAEMAQPREWPRR